MPFLDIFASPRWSPLRMRTKVVSFFIHFQELSNKIIKALRPKMTKIASRGFCLIIRLGLTQNAEIMIPFSEFCRPKTGLPVIGGSGIKLGGSGIKKKGGGWQRRIAAFLLAKLRSTEHVQSAQHFLAPYCGMSFLAISALFLLYIHFGKSLWFTWIPCNEASACRVSIIKQNKKKTEIPVELEALASIMKEKEKPWPTWLELWSLKENSRRATTNFPSRGHHSAELFFFGAKPMDSVESVVASYGPVSVWNSAHTYSRYICMDISYEKARAKFDWSDT